MILNNAKDLNDLVVPPGNRLEALSGNRIGQQQRFASTNGGVSALSGGTEKPGRLRWWTTTNPKGDMRDRHDQKYDAESV